MTSASIWDTLGLEATTDVELIRKAYATRLKVTNPEDDAESFKRLRMAYEHAIGHARWTRRRAVREQANNEEGPSPAPDGDEANPTPIPPAQSAPHENLAQRPEPRSPIDVHMQARMKLVKALRDLEPEQNLIEALDAVLRSEAMEQINVYSSTQQWIVSLLHQARPTSGPLIGPVMKHFGWANYRPRVNEWAGPASLASLQTSIANEAVVREYLSRVRDRRHEFNRAYAELTKAVPKKRGWFRAFSSLRHLGVVDRFLAYTRDKFPDAMSVLDADQVEWWRIRARRVLPLWNWARGILGLTLIFGTVFALMVITPTVRQRAIDHPTDRYAARESCHASMLDARYGDLETQRYVTLNAACEHALSLMPDSLTMKVYLAAIALSGNDRDRSAHLFRDVLTIDPTNPIAYQGEVIASTWAWTARDARGRSLENLFSALDGDALVIEQLQDRANRSQSETDVTSVVYDRPPHGASALDQGTIDSAYGHFGLLPTESTARLRCMARVNGALSTCVVLAEEPANSGAAEMAIHLALLIRIQPATLRGAPVDNAPIELPFRFVVRN